MTPAPPRPSASRCSTAGLLGFKPTLVFAPQGAARARRLPLAARHLHAAVPATPTSAASRSPCRPRSSSPRSTSTPSAPASSSPPSACPAGSVYGRARACTPLLDEPLEGPVYLRSSRTAVPDLVAALRGRGIEIEVAGPDRLRPAAASAPTSKTSPTPRSPSSSLTLHGGKRGLLQNGRDLCDARSRANARYVAQSNATAVGHPKLTVKCKRARKKATR